MTTHNTKLVCSELVQIRNIYGGYDCKTWEQVHIPPPLLPELTKEQANQITVAIIGILVLSWGWMLARKFIEKSAFK